MCRTSDSPHTIENSSTIYNLNQFHHLGDEVEIRAAHAPNHQHQRRGRLDGRRGRIDGRRRLPRAVALHVARGGAGAGELAGVRVLPAAAGALEPASLVLRFSVLH